MKIKQNWTAEQARNDLERLIITGERPADKVVGLACEALEKQIPKKVKEWLPLNRAKCPACNGIMGAHASRKYCYYCGQKIDWSETDG